MDLWAELEWWDLTCFSPLNYLSLIEIENSCWHNDYFPRASRLHGPEPYCEINSAPPSMEAFFINITNCIWYIMGSVTTQNLCIMGVTPTRKRTISQAPILAR